MILYFFWRRILIAFYYFILTNEPIRQFSALIIFIVARSIVCRTTFDAVRKLSLLGKSVRLTNKKHTLFALESEINKTREKAKFSQKNWALALAGTKHSGPIILRKGLIIKPKVSDREPGIIFISFEHQWAQLLNLQNIEQFAADYSLIVSPTWSPPHSPINIVFPNVWPRPVHCLISHEDDVTSIPRINNNYRVIPLLASNWVDENICLPRSKIDRDLDLVMVANFGSFKRHVLLFKALRQMPLNLRVLLIGQNDGKRTSKDVLREAEAFGVKNRFELQTSVPHKQVLESLARARASVVLSYREGSCVAVVESLFADTPVGLIDGAHIGSSKFINEQTGRFLREANLAEDLMTLINSSATMQPRAFAIAQGIGARHSSTLLNDKMKSLAKESGQDWTRDISRIHWCPNPKRLDPQDDLWAAKENAHILHRFGVSIGTETNISLANECDKVS